MNRTQQEALLQYIEFSLISMVEHVDDDVSGLAKAKMYNHAYEVKNDLKDLIDNMELDARSTST